MKYIKNFFFLSCLTCLMLNSCKQLDEIGICICGGTSAGVIAVYTAKQMDKNVILIEPGRRIGGLSSRGLGQTDIGNRHAIYRLCTGFLPPSGRSLREIRTGEGSVKFIPKIPRKGKYSIYSYAARRPGNNKLIYITVFDGKNTSEQTIDPAKVSVEGQTAGEWVSLGNFDLPKEENGFVTIASKNEEVPADAVIFGVIGIII